jgi:hypothetical protein
VFNFLLAYKKPLGISAVWRCRNVRVDGLLVVDQLARYLAGGDTARFRDVVNASPIEADANAAASAFVRTRHPNAVPNLFAGGDKYLVE